MFDSDTIKAKLTELVTRSSMLQGIIDIGDDDFDAALGYLDKIDDARFTQFT